MTDESVVGGKMVESGGIKVDWFHGGGGKGRAAAAAAEEEGIMEVDVRRGDGEDEEDGDDEVAEGRRKRRALMMMGKKEDDEESAEDRMLELRLSLAVAISVPSPHRQQSEKAGAYVLHPHHQQNHVQQVNNTHSLRHSSHPLQLQQQQQPHQLGSPVGRRIESPAKRQLMLDAASASPVLDGQRGSSRPNLTASLKHLVSQQQQQPPSTKVKPAPQRMSSGATAMGAVAHPPFYFGSPPAMPLPHLPAALLRASAAHLVQDGHDAGPHFQSIGRLVSNASSPEALPSQLLRFGAQGPPQPGVHQSAATQQPLYHRGVYPQQQHQQSQPGQPSPATTHRIYSPSASPVGRLQQSSSPIARELGLQLRGGHSGQGTVPSASEPPPSALPFAAAHVSAQASASLTSAGPQRPPPFLQLPNAGTIASHPPSQPADSVPTTNFSAFSVVPPPALPLPISFGDRPPLRERIGDNHVVVNVCDRKVRLTSHKDSSSLYSLSRRWVRNDVLRRDQLILWDSPPLPPPLPLAEARTNRSDAEDDTKQEIDGPEAIESLTPEALLKQHVQHSKAVRKRFRERRVQRIARFMPRLALLLPAHADSTKRETLLGRSQP